MQPDISSHAARRFLRRVLKKNDVKSVQLVHPKHISRVDRIFSPRYHMQTGFQVQAQPLVHPLRQQQLLEAARAVATATKNAARQNTPALPAQAKNKLVQLERRITKLEKERSLLTANLKELTKNRVVPLEKIVTTIENQVQDVQQLKDAVEKNFKKAEQLVNRDARVLKKLRTDVKTKITPALKANQKEIAELKIKLERLQTMHKMFEKIGSYDSVRLKELGERIFLTKQSISKLETNQPNGDSQ